MTSPLRFFTRATLSVLWFIFVSIRSRIAAGRKRGDLNISHEYASALGAGFRRILHLDYHIAFEERLTASQPCVYLVNHRSNLDVVTLSPIYPPKTIVIGKRSILKVPLFGVVFERGGNVAIDRKDRADSLAGIAAAENAIRESGASVFVFPEGTRNFGTLQGFKKGGFHMARNTNVPLVPIVCAVPRAWIDAKRLFIRKRTDVRIEVLDPIDPFRFEALDELIAHAERVMRDALERLEAELHASETPAPALR